MTGVMPNGAPAPCKVIRESGQERCLRCRKVWDAGDNPYCAKFFKPKISVQSVRVRRHGRRVEHFRAIVTWRTSQGRVRTWKGRPFYRSRDAAYDGGMGMVVTAFKRGWIEPW